MAQVLSPLIYGFGEYGFKRRAQFGTHRASGRAFGEFLFFWFQSKLTEVFKEPLRVLRRTQSVLSSEAVVSKLSSARFPQPARLEPATLFASREERNQTHTHTQDFAAPGHLLPAPKGTTKLNPPNFAPSLQRRPREELLAARVANSITFGELISNLISELFAMGPVQFSWPRGVAENSFTKPGFREYFVDFFPRKNSKTQSSLTFYQSRPRQSTNSDFLGLSPNPVSSEFILVVSVREVS